jgi:raffinose/stachyose/melibiose transport system substrate-binding protein
MFRKLLIGVLAAALVVTAAGVALASSTSAKTTQLTLWHNYGTEGNAVATKNLVAAFEKLHPDIKIRVVSQPADNYFALLQSSAISHTSPDLATMWTGLFDLKYAKFLLNLKPYFSAAETNKLNGISYMAPNFNTANGFLVMPLESQFYIGFYNKALFAKAGVTSVPTNWNQLFAACTKLKAKGITPMVYGADTQGLGQTFYPFYDFSYAMSGILSPAQWKGLYTGKTAWTSPKIVSQLTKWAALKTKGCTNPDVLTKSGILGAFTSGKAAMLVDGSWDTATLQKGLGKNLAAFAPPYSDAKQGGVIQYPGDGFSVMKASKHPKEAVEFLKFMMTPQAAKIISAAGLIPDVKGLTTSNVLSNQMLDLAAKGGLKPYPMLDNVIQSEVVDVAGKQLVAAFAGTTSPKKALTSMQDALKGVPSARKGSTYK